MEYIAVTIEGLEDICAQELKGKKIARGRVLFTEWKEDIQSADRIFEVWKKFKFKEFKEIIAKIPEIECTKDVPTKIVCHRDGNHSFKSVDVEKEAGKILREKGMNIEFKEPKQVIYVDVLDKNGYIGVLKKEKLCRRTYKVKIHNQGISGCLAYALLQLVKYVPEKAVLDPRCKDGAIAIEAALLGGKKIYALDEEKNSIRNAAINAKMAGTGIEPKWTEKKKLTTFFKKNEIDLMVTTIILSDKDVGAKKRLTNLLKEAGGIVKERIGIHTNKNNIEECFPKNFQLEEKREIQRGGAKEWIYILNKISDTA